MAGGWGPRGSGHLYMFVGMLTGCLHRRQLLTYTNVVRFPCPVTATLAPSTEKTSAEREGWGPHEFNYVLRPALTRVPSDAEQLLVTVPAVKEQS